MTQTSTITTTCYNFTPDAFEQTCIQKASRGDWDAAIDLCMRDILYDGLRSQWVRVPEPDFDYRRSTGYDSLGELEYEQHQVRLWDGKGQYSAYGYWFSLFLHALDKNGFHALPSGYLPPYQFSWELFTTGYDPSEAAEIFERASLERYARQMEAQDEEALIALDGTRPLTGRDFLYGINDDSLVIVNHRGGTLMCSKGSPEYQHSVTYIKHYYPDAVWIRKRRELDEIADRRMQAYMNREVKA